MKVRFRAEFARDWVLTREATTGSNPITHLRECIQRIIGPEGKIKTLDSGYTDCNLMLFVDNSVTFENFEISLWQTLEDKFQIGKGSKEAQIVYEKILDQQEAEQAEKAQMLAAIKPRVDGLLSCAPYKELLSEIRMIAPEITRLGVQRIFNSRAYLFSVNEGCGYSTYLDIFTSLVSSLGLFEFGEGQKFIETNVEYNDKDPWLQFSAIGKYKNRLISFDINEWIDHMDEPNFKRFLRRLRAIQKDYIYVFRIKYTEEPYLSRIYQVISDALYTRMVVFPEFTYKEYFEFIAQPLSKYGFVVDDDARDEFNKRVLDEKSKGDFYGLRSMRKIAYEMMYRKMLINASNGGGDLIIHANDLSGWTQ